MTERTAPWGFYHRTSQDGIREASVSSRLERGTLRFTVSRTEQGKEAGRDDFPSAGLAESAVDHWCGIS